MLLLALAHAAAAAGCSGATEHADEVRRQVSALGWTVEGMQRGGHGEVVAELRELAGERRAVTAVIWSPEREGPSFLVAGSLPLTYRLHPAPRTTPAHVDQALRALARAIEESGCGADGASCHRALLDGAAGADHGAGRQRTAPPSPLRPALPWLWVIVILLVPAVAARGASARVGPKVVIGALGMALLAAGGAWLLGPRAALMENFHADTVYAEALREDRTTVHGDAVFAFAGLALRAADLDERGIFGGGALLSGLTVFLLTMVLLSSGAGPWAALSAGALLAAHPLWLRYATTEAMVVPSTFLWMCALSRALARWPAARRGRIGALALDAATFALAFGSRPESTVVTVAVLVLGAIVRVRRTGWPGAAALLGAGGLGGLAHIERVLLLAYHAGDEVAAPGASTFVDVVGWHLVGLRPDLGPIFVGVLGMAGIFALRRRAGVVAVVGLAATSWLGFFGLDLYVGAGPDAPSLLRLGVLQLAPLALLTGVALDRFGRRVARVFGPAVVVAALVWSPAFAELVRPDALESRWPERARPMLCDAAARRAPSVVALPGRADLHPRLLPPTPRLLLRACAPGTPDVSLGDLVGGRVELADGESAWVLLDPACDIEVRLDAERWSDGPPLAQLCARAMTLPLREVASAEMRSEPLKPVQRLRTDGVKAWGRLYRLDGPWPR